ncbi:NACHT domain-containing NTPase [Arcobacter sp. s6]|jgi:hypothetical protein|uniref:NACHT domain-containing NTPase n=1 Tax=Arcobacter sp. s6 TaxID=3230363 RepID=UPI0034A069B6
MVKDNWDLFRNKFSGKEENIFEWFCYNLFCREQDKKFGIFRYKNQSAIETEPIQVGNKIIGWQAKFYDGLLTAHKNDLLGIIEKCRIKYKNLTDLYIYTNSEWGQNQHKRTPERRPKALIEIEEEAKKQNINIIWYTKSYFESLFVSLDHKDLSSYFFEKENEHLINFQKILEKYYKSKFEKIESSFTDLKMDIKNTSINIFSLSSQKKLSISNLLKNLDVNKKQLIIGAPGMGKTTLLQYITYLWYSNKEFMDLYEYVIYLPLKKWKQQGLNNFINNIYYSLDSKIDATELLRSSNNVLFLFDGYDELDKNNKVELFEEINKYNLNNIIFTSRSYGLQFNEFETFDKYEILGLEKKEIKSYIVTYFKENNQLKNNLIQFIEENKKLEELASNPLLLEMICKIWLNKQEIKPDTIFQIYSQIIEVLFDEYTEIKDIEKLQDRKELILDYFSEIAFEAMTNRVQILEGTILKRQRFNELRSFFENYILKLGLLKRISIDNRNPLDNSYEFIHLSFLEYFSARYVSKLDNHIIKEIIGNNKFDLQKEQFFKFLINLIENKNLLFDAFYEEPQDIIGFTTNLFNLICLSELQDNEEIGKSELIYKTTLDWLAYCSENNIALEIIISRIYEKSILIQLINYALKHRNDRLLYLCLNNLIIVDREVIILTIKNFISKSPNFQSYRDDIYLFLISKRIFDNDFLDVVGEVLKSKVKLNLCTQKFALNIIDNLSDYDVSYKGKLAKFKEELEEVYHKLDSEDSEDSEDREDSEDSEEDTREEDNEESELSENDFSEILEKNINNIFDYKLSQNMLSELTNKFFVLINDDNIDIFSQYKLEKLAIEIYKKDQTNEKIIKYLYEALTKRHNSCNDEISFQKDYMYLLDQLAFIKNNDDRIIEILKMFISNKNFDLSKKIDIAIGLYINEIKDKDIIVTLLQGFSHSKDLWNSYIDDMRQKDIAGILINDYKLGENEEITVGMQITNHDERKIPIYNYINFINNFEIFKDLTLINDRKFIQSFINAFLLDEASLVKENDNLYIISGLKKYKIECFNYVDDIISAIKKEIH